MSKISRRLAVSILLVVAVSVAFVASSFGSSNGANIPAAKKAIAGYTGHASPFPVTKRLGKQLPAGKKFVYLQCGAPTCALVGANLKQAIAAIRGKLTVISAGFAPATIQAAAASALALKPDAVIVPGITGASFGTSLHKLQAAHIKVVTLGMINAKKYGVDFAIGDIGTVNKAGRLLADWVIATKGAKGDAVFYGAPELDFSPFMQAAFLAEMKKNCPACKTRTSSISVLTIGSTAPTTVANDLRAHPKTNTAVFVTLDMAIGLPAALKTAGQSVTTVGFYPGPVTLSYIKAGQLNAGFGVDRLDAWEAVDAAARLIMGEKVPPEEAEGDNEFLGPKQVPSDVATGWTGYPDYVKRFKKLWRVG